MPEPVPTASAQCRPNLEGQIMSRTPESWRSKAASCAAAWQQKFSRPPTDNELSLALAVAEGETRCGDAWPGEHNWGATTLRSLTDAERQAVVAAGVSPTVGAGRDAAAKAAEAAIGAAGMPSPLGPPVTGRIHCDSYPGRGAYFVWFAAFDDDIAGAAYFLRAICRTGAERAALQTGSAQSMAAAMYAAGYYSGFHPHSTLEGNQANIDDYARMIGSSLPAIRAALAGNPAPPRTLRYGDHGDDVKALQHALNNRDGATSLLAEDGAFGPATESAVIQFQRMHGLAVDGAVGPATRSALGLNT